MSVETKDLNCTVSGFVMTGRIFFNTETRRAIYAIDVHRGLQRITREYGGCLCRDCIGGNDDAYRVFVECVLKVVQEYRLELIENYQEGEELFRAKNDYWFQLSGWKTAVVQFLQSTKGEGNG
ncbi:MAG: hypothetical protein V1716_02465 [Candidatus Uhrbacteria bacterium]